MNQINLNDLDGWADKESQVTLPELVRHLIRVTGRQFTELRMPSGDGTSLPGWDGEVNCANAIHTISAGWSLWEIGTDKEVKRKADDDYNKRTKAPLGYNQKEATFVFVTNRKWPKAQEWVREKRKEGIWKDVKAFSAEELAEWLDEYPSIGIWLASKMGKLDVKEVETPDMFWGRWSKGEKYTIQPDVVLGGRNEVGKKLLESINSNKVFHLQDVSKDAAKGFVAALMLKNDIRNCIIADNKEEAQLILRNYRDICVVTSATGSWNFAAENGNNVIVVVDSEDRCRGAEKLPPIDRDEMRKSLQKSGIDIEKAEKLVGKASGNIMALRRMLKIDSNKPAWANSEAIADLLPAILVGSWEIENEKDKSVVEEFAGCSYTEYERTLHKYLRRPECPVKYENVCRVHSPYDTLCTIADDVYDSEIECLIRWLKIMLYEAADGQYSSQIRHGILRTCIFLSSVNRIGKNQRILADYLQNIGTEDLRSVESYLMEIAEAAPADFLEMVEKQVETNSDWIKQQFGGNEFRYYHYFNLLFALETIAWDKKYMGRVADVLVKLMQYMAPDFYAQNPTSSFKNIFRFVLPQTYVPFEERIRILEKLCKRYKDQGYKLAMLMLSSISDYVFDINQSYSIRDCADDLEERFRYPKSESIERAVELTLLYCSYSTSEVCELLRVMVHPRMKEQRARIVSRIIENKDHIGDVQEVCQIARKVIRDKKVLNNLVQSLIPDDVIQKHIYLFSEIYLRLPDVDFDDEENEQQKMREEAIKAILAERGLHGIKEYALAVREPRCLGERFGCYDAGEHFSEIAKWCENNETLCQFMSGYVNGLVCIVYQENVTPEMMREWMKQMPNQLMQAHILSKVYYVPTIGRYIETLETDAQDEYWQNWDRLSITSDLEWQVQNLMRVGRLEFAKDLIYCSLVTHKSIAIQDEVVYELLMQYEMDPNVRADTSVASQVRRLIAHIEKLHSKKVQDGLYGIELKYYDWYDEIEPFDSVRLGKDMVANPELMTRLIGICELPDEHQEDELVAYQKNINKLLWETNCIPCANEAGTVDYTALNQYINKLLGLCIEPKSEDRAYKIIGVLLSNIPNNSVPDEELCELIEKLDSRSLDDAYVCHILSQEKATFRDCGEGGDIEYAIADTYNDVAGEQMGGSHVQYIYDSLAKHYCHLGEMQDGLAKKYEEM